MSPLPPHDATSYWLIESWNERAGEWQVLQGSGKKNADDALRSLESLRLSMPTTHKKYRIARYVRAEEYGP